MSKKKNTKTNRAPGKTQISISLPQDLVKKIDKLAATENRNRSNFIATALDRITSES
ncbi:CopG family ribbon-helix-helix protein [Cerasicoccus frondis]|uniref:CopG family ribbon-helix-helix protein n=1 Tax=Cerasicoccus frondis TaxID=490090 RepID=UPI002852BF86|nr:ribbon-helix-helix protein, CopG family [Cerasicoccus frondis]